MNVGFFGKNLACTIGLLVIMLAVVFASPCQAQTCTFTTSPAVVEAGHGGGAYTINFTASDSACNWTVSSADDWITVTSAARGTGSGTLTVAIKPNTGTAARRGRIDFRRQYVWVNQPPAPPCTYTLSQTGRSVAPGSGQTSVYVRASDPGCAWTVDEMAPWLHLSQQGQQGKQRTGSGSVHFGFYTNPSASARSGTVKVAGQTFTVTQEPCAYTVSPSSISRSANSGGAGFSIKTNDQDCRWSVEETAGWIMINSNEKSGKGDKHVQLHFMENKSNSARSAQIKVKDKTVNVTQQGPSSTQQGQAAAQTTQPSAKTDPTSAQMSVGSPTASSTSAKKASSGGAAGCSFALSKASQNIGAKDGRGSFSVKTDSGCEWKAVSNAGWISIVSGSSGKGKGTVKFSVQENRESAPRTGQIVVAGQTFSVNQKGQKTGNKERKHR